VLRTTVTELVGVMEMAVKKGATVVGRVALAPSNVTAVDANALPTIVLVVSMVTAVPAIMVPSNAADVPITASVVTCQKMLPA
jgi:hypothetical protein